MRRPGAMRQRHGGKLVVCNHIGWADPIWLAYAAHPRMLHQMAKEQLFQRPWVGRLLRSLGAFPVNRGKPSASTLKVTLPFPAAESSTPTSFRPTDSVSASGHFRDESHAA